MRIINLCHGAGNGVDSACVMTASNMLIGKGYHGDTNSCVCPLIREFVIATNDAIPLELLGELYTPLIWEILGTRNPDVESERVFCFVDWLCREVLPLWYPGLKIDAIVDYSSAQEAGRALQWLGPNPVRDHASYACHYAQKDTIYPECGYGPTAVRYVSYALRYMKSEAAWRKCPDIVRRVAAIGEKQKIEFAITIEELENALLGN